MISCILKSHSVSCCGTTTSYFAYKFTHKHEHELCTYGCVCVSMNAHLSVKTHSSPYPYGSNYGDTYMRVVTSISSRNNNNSNNVATFVIVNVQPCGMPTNVALFMPTYGIQTYVRTTSHKHTTTKSYKRIQNMLTYTHIYTCKYITLYSICKCTCLCVFIYCTFAFACCNFRHTYET